VDFALFDMEHAAFGIDTIRAVVSYCRGTTVTPVVRVPVSKREYVSRVLDAGAQGVMAPMIETGDEAREFVAAALYAPAGNRGVAHGIAHDDFLPSDPTADPAEANRQVLTIAMIETADGLRNVDEIAACPGLDVLWIGHYDLAASLGVSGDISGQTMLDAFHTVASAAARHGKLAGRGVMTVESAVEWSGQGFSAFTYSRDIVMLRDTLGGQLKAIRSLTGR
jgi:2-dehydro-3-deoxyglucarate aldolase/4-hydroxy-2-oxoheptanedioate aldolase